MTSSFLYKTLCWVSIFMLEFQTLQATHNINRGVKTKAKKRTVKCKMFIKLWLTAERLRWGPSDRITSSVRSDWSESQTKPMVTISGEFIRTRLIPILWPHLLWKTKKQKKKEHSFTQKQVTKKHIEQITEKWYLNLLNNCSFTEHELIKALYIGHLLDSYEGPQSYLLLVTVPQMTRVCVEASVD